MSAMCEFKKAGLVTVGLVAFGAAATAGWKTAVHLYKADVTNTLRIPTENNVEKERTNSEIRSELVDAGEDTLLFLVLGAGGVASCRLTRRVGTGVAVQQHG